MSKLDRETLIMCKNRIMQGQSISSIAREIGVDRKDLKSKILEILSDEEKNEFNEKLKHNFRRNRKSARNIKKENREEKYKMAVQTLVRLGITKEDIETISRVLSTNRHTTMAKDTFAIKLVEILEFIKERNQGIEVNDEGYITSKDVINMIIKDPRFMTNDVKRKLKPMCDILDNWSSNVNKYQINSYIKQYPEIFKNSIKKLKMHLIIGDNFLVKFDKKYIPLSEYIITENPFLISENSSKFFRRVCMLKDSTKSGIIEEKDLNGSFEETEEIKEKYELPEYEDNESFRRAVEDVINRTDREDKSKKGEEI